MFKFFYILIALLLGGLLFFHKTIIREIKDYQSIQLSKKRAALYALDNSKAFKDITPELITDPNTPSELKAPLIDGTRRIIVFKYLSDGKYVAGYYSFLTNGEHPTLIFLRGGNKFFGIMRPNNRFSFLNGYNVIGTLYRGNIYEGEDEFGGEDINDVENLVKFLPQVEDFIKAPIKTPKIIMGVSRGALEMFNSLAKSDVLKKTITYAISVSGNVDLRVTMKNRPEMKYLFKDFYKQSNGKDFDEWIKLRNPVDISSSLPQSIKVLLVYGLADDRVLIEEQQNLQDSLKKENIPVKLVTIQGADHGFEEHFSDLEKTIYEFLA